LDFLDYFTWNCVEFLPDVSDRGHSLQLLRRNTTTLAAIDPVCPSASLSNSAD
jgi:hypothetical protein